jgi:hypothetical protein
LDWSTWRSAAERRCQATFYGQLGKPDLYPDQPGCRRGTNYQEMGLAELLSVPYALYAGNAANNEDADADPTNELQDWTTLPGIPADISDGDQVDDADADPTNELELPTDAQTGDIAYYDGEAGSEYQRERPEQC